MIWSLPFALFLALCGWAYLRASRPKQRLSDEQIAQVRAIPERRRNQHLVDVVLDDGRTIKGVYIAYSQFVVPGLMPWRRVRAESIREIKVHT